MSEEMFSEAVQALKTSQRRRARDLLTRLIKADSSNADYWLWMSASVDTEKEQILCLQRALKAAPNSLAARRGLVMLGALTPEDAALPPAPTLNQYTPAQPVRTVARAALRNRDWIAVVAIALMALCAVGAVITFLVRPDFFLPVAVIEPTPVQLPTLTPEPTQTLTVTPTPLSCEPPAEINVTISLAEYLCATPAPTRAYVPTEAVNRPEEAYQSVRSNYRKGNWDGVLSLAAQAIELYPSDPYPYFYAAEAQRLKGDTRGATDNYQQAIAKDAQFAPAYYGRALLRFQLNRADTAVRDLDVAANANYVPAFVARAEYLTATGNVARALEDLESARALAGEDVNVLARLALAYVDNARPQDAVIAADTVLGADKTSVIAYYARGRAHYDLGEFEAANADLNLSYRYITEVASFATLFPVASAVKADGLYAANALYYFGATQAALGDDEAALAAFTQAIERSRTVALPRVARGQLLLKTQKYAEARDDFTAAIAQYTRDKDDSPRVGEAYLGNGLAWLALNRPDSAVSNFQVALRTLPTSFEANFGLGQSLARTNKPDEALTPLSAALVLAQTDEQRAQVLWWRARAHSLAGRRPEEVADLQTLAALTGGGTLVPTAQARLTEIAIQSRGTNTPTPRVTATATRTATVARTTTRTATVTPPPSPSPTLNRTAYPASGTPASPTPTRPGTGYPPRTPRP